MPAGDNNRLGSFVVNGGVNKRALRQLEVRGTSLGRRNKSDKDLLFANASTPWIKISSAANIDGTAELAKDHILLGGTAYQRADGLRLKGGFKDFSFGEGYSNNPEDRGIVPIPGVNSLTIEYAGNLGVLKYFNFDFKVYDLNQLEIYEKLYMKPGISVLIEYGHSLFLNNQGDLISDASTIDGFFENGITQSELQVKGTALTLSSDYNYNGEIALISNFEYSYDRDGGGYSCKVKAISKNSLFEGVTTTGTPAPEKASKGTQEVRGPELLSTANLAGAGVIDTLDALEALGQTEEYEKMANSLLSPISDFTSLVNKAAGTTESILSKIQEKYPDLEWPTNYSPYYLNKVSDKKGTKKMIYMKLGGWMKVFHDFLLPTGNKGEKLVKLAYGPDVYMRYATYDNHFSLNPHVILPKSPANKNLYLGSGDKNKIFENGREDNIYDIWVSTDLIDSMLSDFFKKSPEELLLIEFIDDLLDKICRAIGGYNDFILHYEEKADNFIIIDKKATDRKNLKTHRIQVSGKESVVRDLKISSAITAALMKTITISAQVDPKDAEEYGLDLQKYTDGVQDRTKIKIDDPKGATAKSAKLSTEELLEEAVKQFWKDRKIDEDQEALVKGHREMTLQGFNKGNPNVNGIMPYSLSFQIDGHSGFAPMQNFTISDGIIPQRVNDIIAFRITKVNHKIDESGWVTDITALMFFDFKKNESEVEETPVKEISAADAEEVELKTDKEA